MKRIIILIVVLILLIGGGIGFYFYQIHKAPTLSELLTIKGVREFSDVQKENFEEAKALLEKNINDYKGLTYLAILKNIAGDTQGAIEIYNKMLTIKTQDILPLNNLAQIYYDLKDYKKAEELSLKILSISPKWMNSYDLLMDLYQFHLTDKRADLEPILLNGLEIYPEMKTAMLSKLAVYYDEFVMNKEKALQYYKELIKVDPNNQSAAARLRELLK